jgi:1-acyl-sn-glycerol-3-phosphate acyltransferase
MAGLGEALQERLKAWTFELGGPGTRARLEKLTPPRNEYGVDPYGLDVEFTVAAIAPLLWLYKRWFRVQLHGADRVPSEGRVLVVWNHSGQLPFDAAMIEVGLLVDKDPPRVARALIERWVPTLPFVSTFMARCGQIVGTPENCRRLLGFPAFPITPTILPFPLPSRYHVRFGEPMRFSGSPDDDDAELERKVAEVEGAIRALLDRGLAERRSVYL